MTSFFTKVETDTMTEDDIIWSTYPNYCHFEHINMLEKVFVERFSDIEIIREGRINSPSDHYFIMKIKLKSKEDEPAFIMFINSLRAY